MPAGEAQPPGIAKQSAMMMPELAETSGEAGPSWLRANGNSVAATAAAKSAGETRPTRIVKYSVTSESESEFAESSEETSDEAVPGCAQIGERLSSKLRIGPVMCVAPKPAGWGPERRRAGT